MVWNWEQPDWPNFRYRADALKTWEPLFREKAGLLSGVLRHLSEEDKRFLTVDLMAQEAVKTSEIEGEFLDRDSVQSSLQRNFGFKVEEAKASPAERGIAALMTDLYRRFDAPLRKTTLLRWNTWVLGGRPDVREAGRYRTSLAPMRVVSGPVGKPKVHFEAPPSSRIAQEMKGFVRWFQASAGTTLALARAGIAHLYFVSLHPFEDGNGRLARAISEKSLAESLGRPTLIALAQTMQERRKDYYEALARNNRSLEIDSWLSYFAQTVLAALDNSLRRVEFVVAKTHFFDRHRGSFNSRQEKALVRMFREGPKGFAGGMSAEKYIAITAAPRATATRDLQDLVKTGALKRTGELKGTRYFLRIGNAL